MIGNWLLTSPPPILELKYFLMGPVFGHVLMSDQFYCKFLAIFGGFLGFLSFALPNWPPFPQINVLKYTLNKLIFIFLFLFFYFLLFFFSLFWCRRKSQKC